MVRVTIRCEGQQTGKVLRFDESIEFHVLLRKIVDKLGVTHHSHDDSDSDPSQLFELRLGVGSVLEDTNEIEHGDELVLFRIEGDVEEKGNAKAGINREESDNTRGKVKAENDTNDKNDERDIKPVEIESSSVGKRMLRPRKSKSTDDIEVLSISSDEDEDEDENSSESDDEPFDDEDYESSEEEEEQTYPNASPDYGSRPSKRCKTNPKPSPDPPLEVIMEEKDIPSAPGKCDNSLENDSSKNIDSNGMEEVSLLVNGAGKKKSEQEVKNRIIKLLNTGFHEKSNEHEAKNAMKLAQRLMRKHNLSQALLLRERETKNNQKEHDGEVLKGGMVRIKIVNRKTRKPTLFARWISDLTHPVCTNFGVKAYHQTRRGVRCDVVFYGIYSNAQLAGYAFKVATERISQMMTEYQPDKPSSRDISTKSSRLSYALGIVQGISEDVEKNLQMEEIQRKRKLERARLAESKGEAYAESDDDDDGEGVGFSAVKEEDEENDELSQTAIPNHVKASEVKVEPTSKSISGVDLQSRVAELEKEEQAALVLVDHKKKIAEEVLKTSDIKLRTGRKRKAIEFDRQSYDRGVKDSKEIDMNQRAIRDEIKIKVEKNRG
mmetsp:Transcript_6156/g.17532  ORF Transcript_6156/g.17532 Transcript_6156/m.17532 type:complete len:606 (+) Transcript_6156:1588-3405(+)|eukprot:CAMPEP_0172369476 /NCGR_PEP_ID=MMETSP1060-20121228/33143_1 /TAXON_ID=37318 /ORGANISM="Pseudo-nitzschia pungens, Strain cf. cingulata" /LENGTH=605 /DNA_ID=CAMNT_0013094419 /DNA_START=1524 /DNA_END=3341 /DNA_ORIENTATION=+